jgi:hypothetical protein
MTGADRTWAARYEVGDVLHYQRGSRDVNMEKHSYAKVVTMQLKENLLTVEKPDGARVTYNSARLRGISSYRGNEREYAIGDRLIFTRRSGCLMAPTVTSLPSRASEKTASSRSAWIREKRLHSTLTKCGT